MRYNHLKLVFSLSLILSLGAVYSVMGGKPRKMQQIPSGTWGGPSIRIQISGGAATIEYDCAHGTIKGPLKVDRKGKFSLAGTHVGERGGPTRLNDENRPGQPARFTGWTDGKTMTLTVTLTAGNEDIGTFKLARGQEGRLRKCR